MVFSTWVSRRQVFRLIMTTFNTQPFRLAVVSVLFLVGPHQSGGGVTIQCFLNYISKLNRWGLRITPGLTLLSALLVLFFMYDPPRCLLFLSRLRFFVFAVADLLES